MAILDIKILANLSLSASQRLLLEEGYILKHTLLEDDEVYDKVCIHPYYLFDKNNKKVDAIYYTEYCIEVPDDDYSDGRTTLEAIRSKWQKNKKIIKNINFYLTL